MELGRTSIEQCAAQLVGVGVCSVVHGFRLELVGGAAGVCIVQMVEQFSCYSGARLVRYGVCGVSMSFGGSIWNRCGSGFVPWWV